MVKEYEPTHMVPPTGLPAWPTPDGTGPPIANLDPGLDIQVTHRRADWARIRCSNDWEAWIDGRNLIALAVETPAPPPADVPPPQADVPPPPHADLPPAQPVPSPHSDAPPARPTPRSRPVVPAATSALPWPSPAAPAPPLPRTATAPTAPVASPAAAWTSAAPPRPPTQSDPWAAGGRAQPRSFGPAQIGALIGSAIVVISGFFPWLEIAGDTANAYDSPVKFLFDAVSQDEGVNLGIVLLALGVVGMISVFVRPVRWLCIATGAVAVVIGLRFIQQANELLDIVTIPGTDVGLADFVKFGVYLAIGGGVIAIVGGILSLRRSS
jgi:hypothetical protein